MITQRILLAIALACLAMAAVGLVASTVGLGAGENFLFYRWLSVSRSDWVRFWVMAATLPAVAILTLRLMGPISIHVITLMTRWHSDPLYPLAWQPDTMGRIPTVMAGCVVAMIASTSPLGFDITDEGFALLASRNPELVSFNWSLFHWVTYLLIGQFDPPIPIYRLARLALLVTSALVLAQGFLVWAEEWIGMKTRGAPSDQRSIMALIVLASLLGYSWQPNQLHYNDYANAGIGMIGGTALYGLTSAAWHNLRVRATLALLAGAVITLAGMSKPPTGMVLAAVMLTSWGVGSWRARRSLPWGECALAFFGALLPILACVSLGLDLPRFVLELPEIRRAIAAQSLTGESLAEAAVTAWRQLSGLAAFTSIPSLLLITTAAAHAWAPPPIKSAATHSAPWLVSAIVGWYVYTGLTLGYWPIRFAPGLWVDYAACWYCTAASSIWLYVLLTAAGASLFMFLFAAPRLWPAFPILAGLFLLPFAGSIGTNGGYFHHAVSFAGPWAAAIIAFLYLCPAPVSTAIRGRILIGMAVIATIQIVEGHILWPFRQWPQPLWQQTEPVIDLPRARGLRIAPEMNAAIAQLRAIVYDKAGYQAADPLIPLYDVQGLTYLLEGVSPGYMLYRNTPSRVDMACFLLPRTPHNMTRALLLVTDTIGDRLASCLQQAGVAYPDAYRVVGQVNFPRRGDFAPFIVSVLAPTPAPR